MSSEKEKALERARHDGNTVDIAICPITDIELYFTTSSNQKFIFEDFGTCADCNVIFHTSALEMSDGINHSSWPVHYLGYSCKACYYKDDKIEEAEELSAEFIEEFSNLEVSGGKVISGDKKDDSREDD